jgi:hypothetical protein
MQKQSFNKKGLDKGVAKSQIIRKINFFSTEYVSAQLGKEFVKALLLC